jgi:predicted ArsR family transcriptional regulator
MTSLVPHDLSRLSALGTPQARAALLYARAAGGPFTVQQAAEALGWSRSAARQQLDRLEGAGLLLAEFRRPAGRSGPGAGRPAKVFRVAPEVHVTEFPPHRYAELIGLLLDGDGAPDEEARRRIGRRFARTLAAGVERSPLPPRLDRSLPALCALLGALGYQARVVAAQRRAGALSVPTCPLRPVVLATAGAVELDRGLWEGLAEVVVGRDLPDLSCDTGNCLDCDKECLVRFELRSEQAA